MNTALFKYCTTRAGFSLAKLADVLGINPATLYRKMTGESDFTRAEMTLIKECLDLTFEEVEKIFFTD